MGHIENNNVKNIDQRFVKQVLTMAIKYMSVKFIFLKELTHLVMVYNVHIFPPKNYGNSEKMCALFTEDYSNFKFLYYN